MANLKWAYMDHYSLDPGSPRGKIGAWSTRKYAERYIKQLTALGFQGIDRFAEQVGEGAALFGSMKDHRKFLQDMGIEKIAGLFASYSFSPMLHIRASHDFIVSDFERMVKIQEGSGVEHFIIMPANKYWIVEPVTDEKIHILADLWNRVGKMLLSHGLKASFHHEFHAAISRAEEVEKFYAWTDPQYVYFYCDTAQHAIAGVDPVKLFLKYHDRCIGFHLKDTHNVDTTQYRLPPNPEIFSNVDRWFWEMGTPEGLVDFPALFRGLKEYNWRGWVSVEHDATTDYPDSTCYAKWYIDNVLTKIYS